MRSSFLNNNSQINESRYNPNKKIQLSKFRLTSINNKQSAYIGQYLQNPNPTQQKPNPYYLLKCYHHQNQKQLQQQQKILKSFLMNNLNNPLIPKPLSYCIQYKKNNNKLFICSQLEKMSLDRFLNLHRIQNKPVNIEIIKSFSKIYETIHRLHKAGITHNNLKPGNIFMYLPNKLIETKQDIQWKISQTTLMTKYGNKFYSNPMLNIPNNNMSSINLNNSSTNKSSNFYGPSYLQNDFYSLGLMLIEMVTLDPIQKIIQAISSGKLLTEYFGQIEELNRSRHNIMRDQKDNYKMQNLRRNRKIKDDNLIPFIKALLNIKDNYSANRDQKSVYSDFYNGQDNGRYNNRNIDKFKPQINYQDYFLTIDGIQKYISSQITTHTIKQMVSFIFSQQFTTKNSSQNDRCKKIFQDIQYSKIDENYDFYFQTVLKLEDFLRMFRIKLNREQLLMFGFYYINQDGFIGYMKILFELFNKRIIAQNILKICFKKFNSITQFFQDRTSSKDLWKAQQISQFFYLLRIPFTIQDVKEIFRSWGINQKVNYIKLQQFKKIFKDPNQMAKSTTKISDQDTNIKNISTQLLLQLAQNVQYNLVNFFGKFDYHSKFSVEFEKIKEQIQRRISKTKYKKSELTKIYQFLLDTSRLSETSYQIDYIVLLKRLNIYPLIQLFRMILTQIINQVGKQKLFNKYIKDKKNNQGWTRQSLDQFCEDRYINFTDKQKNAIFEYLDKDNNQYVNMKQFMHKVTNLEQFDVQDIISKIKDSVRNKKQTLFNTFIKIDNDTNLTLNNYLELGKLFDNLNIKIKQQHLKQLYEKYSKNGQFLYLVFLRHFNALDEIFVWTCKILIDKLYAGNFDKFFDKGLRGQKTKWTIESLRLINQSCILGFNQKQIIQLWNLLDQRDEKSLTKNQIANIFGQRIQKLEEFKPRDVQYLGNLRSNNNQKDNNNNQRPLASFRDNNSNNNNRQQSQRQINFTNYSNQLQSNELVSILKKQQLLPLIKQFYRCCSKQSMIYIKLNEFYRVLEQERIKYTKKNVQTNFKNFLKQNDKSSFNYFNFLMLICQFKPQKNIGREKCILMNFLLQDIIYQKRYSTNEIFNSCKIKNQMSYKQYQKIIHKLIDNDVYSSDIEDVWEFYCSPNYLNQKDWEQIMRGNYSNLNQGKDGGDSSSRRMRKNFTFNQANDYQDKRQSNNRQRQRQRQKEKNNYDNRNRRDNDFKNKDKDYNYKNNRKQSNDSVQLNKFAVHQREKQQTGKFFRNNNAKKNQQDKSYNNDNKYKKSDQKALSKPPLARSSERRTTLQQDLSNKTKNPIQLFRKIIERNSINKIQKLFQNSNNIYLQDFIQCLEKNYNIKSKQAQDIANELNYKGKIYLQDIEKLLDQKQGRKQRQSSKQRDKQRQRDRNIYRSRSKQQSIQGQNDRKRELSRQRQRSIGRNQRNSKDTRKDLISPMNKIQNKESLKDTNKFDDRNIVPVTRSVNPQRRLSNPRKTKLNAPLIKEHIKVIIQTFSQRFAVQEIQKYFFQQSESIQRAQFTKKCKQINSTISQSMMDKIFDFMKPSIQRDQINIISFKLAFNYDEQTQVIQNYLPVQLQAQLKDIFQKNDKDKSGYIEIAQIQALLTSLGFNQSQRQIEQIFTKMDKNFDRKIEYDQFKNFIEEYILPFVQDFDDQVDELLNLLRMNDIFNTGCLSINVLLSIIQRYGVNLTTIEGVNIVRFLGNQNQQIPIQNFVSALYYPFNPSYPAILKTALYKIKFRKRISLKDIQKIFQNISSNFILAYTSMIIKSQQLKRSYCFEPFLHQSYMFYQDYYYKDFRKLTKQGNKNLDKLLVEQKDPTTSMVQIKLVQLSGVPIPQNATIKSNIIKRTLNITFFNLSSETVQYSITTIMADWDKDTQDEWILDKNNRSIFVKISNYNQDPKKYQKMLVLIQLIITVKDSTSKDNNNKSIDISCGSASVTVKQLMEVDSKLQKKIKLIAGIPNKAKEIDKNSITKKSGLKKLFGSSSIQSQLEIQISHQSKFKDYQPKLNAFPSICIVSRKSVFYLWSFRQYFADRSIDRNQINPDFVNHHTVKAFLFSLDIQDIYFEIINFWKETLQQNIKSAADARTVMYCFLTDFYMILNTKQFELKQSNPTSSVIANKGLYNTRQKMLSQLFQNIQIFVKNDLHKGKPYKRSKNYNYNFLPIIIQKGKQSVQKMIYQNMLKVGKV